MATYALIHGAADTGWFWHLVAAELRERGHEVAHDLAVRPRLGRAPQVRRTRSSKPSATAATWPSWPSVDGFTAPGRERVRWTCWRRWRRWSCCRGERYRPIRSGLRRPRADAGARAGPAWCWTT